MCISPALYIYTFARCVFVYACLSICPSVFPSVHVARCLLCVSLRMKSDAVVALAFKYPSHTWCCPGVRGGMRVWGRFFVGNRLHAAPSDLLGESPSDDDDHDDDDVLLLFSRCFSRPLFPRVALGLMIMTI